MPRTGPFDIHSDRYERWFQEHPDIYQAELAALRQLVPPQPTKSLEVGVGSGQFAAALNIKIGVEPSEEMALKAEKKGIRVYRGVAEALPFDDCRFDLVLMVTTICFVDDVGQAFAEAFRVLKSGGCIVVGFVDKHSELARRYQDNRDKNVFYREATFFSSGQVSAQLIQAGFRQMASKQTLFAGENPHRVEDGFDKGAFIAVKGVKP